MMNEKKRSETSETLDYRFELSLSQKYSRAAAFVTLDHHYRIDEG